MDKGRERQGMVESAGSCKSERGESRREDKWVVEETISKRCNSERGREDERMVELFSERKRSE